MSAQQQAYSNQQADSYAQNQYAYPSATQVRGIIGRIVEEKRGVIVSLVSCSSFSLPLIPLVFLLLFFYYQVQGQGGYNPNYYPTSTPSANSTNVSEYVPERSKMNGILKLLSNRLISTAKFFTVTW